MYYTNNYIFVIFFGNNLESLGTPPSCNLVLLAFGVVPQQLQTVNFSGILVVDSICQIFASFLAVFFHFYYYEISVNKHY
jgi:hypothetical protein